MLISGMATFNACGTTSGSTNASNGSLLGDAIAGAVAQNGNNTTGETLGNLLSQLLNNSSTLTQDDLVGTWKYQSPDCVFESENLLAKAGGEVAAQKIESLQQGQHLQRCHRRQNHQRQLHVRCQTQNHQDDLSC